MNLLKKNLQPSSPSCTRMLDEHPSSNLWYFLLAWLLLPVVKGLHKTKGFRWTSEKIHKQPFEEFPAKNRSTPNASIAIAGTIHKAVLRAGRCWPGKRNNCLERASVACLMLRAKNIPCSIKIGFKGTSSNSLDSAHAWIQVLGEPIGESSQTLVNFNSLTSSSKINA